MGQFRRLGEENCYIFEECTLLLLPVEGAGNRYRRVELSTRLFDCDKDKVKATSDSRMRKMDENFEDIILV